jgi:hypothetical protein
MAIVGLLLLTGGLLYPWTKAYELEKELIVLEAQISQAKEKQTQPNVIELEKNLKLARLTFKATIAYFVLGTLSFIFGCILTINGFRFWYLRVQKKLDEQLLK